MGMQPASSSASHPPIRRALRAIEGRSMTFPLAMIACL